MIEINFLFYIHGCVKADFILKTADFILCYTQNNIKRIKEFSFQTTYKSKVKRKNVFSIGSNYNEYILFRMI